MFEYKVTLRTYKKVADVKRGWKGPEHEKITQDMWTWVESHKDSNNQLKAVFDAGKEELLKIITSKNRNWTTQSTKGDPRPGTAKHALQARKEALKKEQAAAAASGTM